MWDDYPELIAGLKSALIDQRYSPVVVRNYCAYASGFLDFLGQRGIPIAEVVDAVQVVYGAIPKKIFKTNPDYWSKR
jgi:uncharacterized protein (DUF1810 family)